MSNRKRTSIARGTIVVSWTLAILALGAVPSLAQLNGFNIRGDVGLNAGTQAPPGPYYAVAFLDYRTDTIKDRDGKQLTTGDGSFNLFGFSPLVTVVTKHKLLGANYGFVVAPAVINSSMEAPRFDQNPGLGLGDTFVQPINLGWHMKQADVIVGYGFYAPTGRYTTGADDNTGLDMWGHELAVGTTVFFDAKRQFEVSTLAAFEFHTKKRHSDAQVGTLLTMEGGVGRSFAGGGARAGLVYVAQWKLNEDTLTGLPALLVRGKNSMAALGPEVTLPIVAKGRLISFLTVRYEWDVYARATTQGNTLLVVAAFPFTPIRIK